MMGVLGDAGGKTSRVDVSVDALEMVEDWGVVSDGNVLAESVIEVVVADGEVVVASVAVAADPTTQCHCLGLPCPPVRPCLCMQSSRAPTLR